MYYKKLEDIQEKTSSDILDSSPPVIYTIKQAVIQSIFDIGNRFWAPKHRRPNKNYLSLSLKLNITSLYINLSLCFQEVFLS